MIKIDFEFETKFGRYADALHLPEDHGMTDAQIQAMKEERRDNWLSHIEVASTSTQEPDPVIEAPTDPEFIEINGVKYKKA